VALTIDPRIQAVLDRLDEQAELQKLVGMLDEYEVRIAISYLSKLLLSRAKPYVNPHRYNQSA